MGREWTSMICRQCGASLANDETSCHQCGYHAQTMTVDAPARVISLHQKRRIARRASNPGIGSRTTLLWVLGIVLAALILPYLMPLHA